MDHLMGPVVSGLGTAQLVSLGSRRPETACRPVQSDAGGPLPDSLLLGGVQILAVVGLGSPLVPGHPPWAVPRRPAGEISI